MFDNKAVIVTGSGSGIGKATAKAFANKGANIVVSDINDANGLAVQKEINDQGGSAIFVHADVAQEEDIFKMINTCIDKFGRLDVLVNNAGIGGPLAFFDQISNEDWNRIIAVNQTGVFYGMKAALKIMKTQKSGNIINISSVAGIGSAARMGAYAASKHAVVGMTTSAAVEYAKYGIRINAICPTVIKTPMGDSYINEDEAITERLKQFIPMKRFGQPEEVANTICWLCSDDASYITGHTIRTDGGMKA